MWDILSSQMSCHLGIKALLGFHSMSFLYHDVYHAGVSRLCVDEQLHAHDIVEDGVQRHEDRSAFHQCDEAVAGSAAPLVPQDDGLGWRTHSTNLELLSLRPQRVWKLIFVFTFQRLSTGFQKNDATHTIATWKGWDRRSEGSSLRLLQATTAVLPKSKKKTCRLTGNTLFTSTSDDMNNLCVLSHTPVKNDFPMFSFSCQVLTFRSLFKNTRLYLEASVPLVCQWTLMLYFDYLKHKMFKCFSDIFFDKFHIRFLFLTPGWITNFSSDVKRCEKSDRIR